MHRRSCIDFPGVFPPVFFAACTSGMHGVAVVLFFTAVLLSPMSMQADERRRSGTDTARHRDGTVDQLTGQTTGLGRIRSAPARIIVPADPAVRRYWSDKCVQQRARGWGHSGDCEHPTYHGGYGGRHYRWYPGNRYPGYR